MHILPDFSSWSLRKKLVSIIMLSSAVCLLVSLSVMIVSSVSSRYRDTLEQISGLADILAENGQAALIFSDKDEAQRLLKSLESHHEISAAWLVSANNVVLASWNRKGIANAVPVDYRVASSRLRSDFWSRRADLYMPVTKGHERIGYVLLQADFTEQWDSQMSDLGMGLGGAILALVVVFLLATRLQRLISRPIGELADTARAIALDKTYGLRVPQRTHDEIGDLVLAFNEMLWEIQKRDESLTSNRDHLEEEVGRRTEELRTILENTPDTIARYDLDCRLIYVNPVFDAMTDDGGAAAMQGRKPTEFPGGNNAEVYEAKINEVIATGNNVQFELKWLNNEGKEICSHIRLTAERDLSGAIISVLAVGRDITELNESRAALERANTQLGTLNDQLQSLATSDPLTHLPNRRLLMDRLNHALASSTRSGQTGALLFIDLDNFKTINDTLGHDVGDLLLQQVAQRLQASVREDDTVARIGGDEFVVMLEDLSKDSLEAAAQAEIIGNKILSSLNHPYLLAAREYSGTSSIGVTLFNDHHNSIDTLFKQADLAMYQSKRTGRNTLHFFDPRMQENIDSRAAVESELRYAIEQGQFQLHYQVQVDSLHNPLGAEALIRWNHPERGLVAPEQFIQLAEETGLILPIGAWVLETACIQLKAWGQDALTRHLVLAVNVSARQFRQPDFAAQVQSLVQRNGIDPKLLNLELTESLLLEDVGGTIATIEEMRKIGIRFSLDDFGTGYSSLQYLKQLSLDQLKIDRSFVRDIVVNISDKAIVGTIIAMARSLGLDVIAEGVETQEQRQLLLHSGCTHFQGYLFGKPMPIEEFETLMRGINADDAETAVRRLLG